MITKQLYGGKHTLSFNEGVHRYKVNGEYKHGVTTMLSLLGKEGLIQWSANMAVEAMLGGADPQEAKYAWMTKRDKAGDTGTLVHKWIEDHIQGNDTEVTEAMKPSVTAFLRWEDEVKPKYIDSERMIYSEKYDYCGTVDIVFEAGGKRYVADFKTANPDKEYNSRTKRYSGKLRARTEHFYQNALYDQAIEEEDGLKADRYMVIYICKDGELHHFETDLVDVYRESAVRLVEFFKANKESDRSNVWQSM